MGYVRTDFTSTGTAKLQDLRSRLLVDEVSARNSENKTDTLWPSEEGMIATESLGQPEPKYVGVPKLNTDSTAEPLKDVC